MLGLSLLSGAILVRSHMTVCVSCVWENRQYSPLCVCVCVCFIPFPSSFLFSKKSLTLSFSLVVECVYIGFLLSVPKIHAHTHTSTSLSALVNWTLKCHRALSKHRFLKQTGVKTTLSHYRHLWHFITVKIIMTAALWPLSWVTSQILNSDRTLKSIYLLRVSVSTQ